MRNVSAMAITIALIGALGCDRDRGDTTASATRETASEAKGKTERGMDEKSTTREKSTEMQTTQTAGAVATITKARCEREARCGNVGADKDYSDLSACQTKVREEWKQDLNAIDCPAGIAKAELTECVSAIQNEDCNRPIEKLERIVACRTGDLCMASR